MRPRSALDTHGLIVAIGLALGVLYLLVEAALAQSSLVAAPHGVGDELSDPPKTEKAPPAGLPSADEHAEPGATLAIEAELALALSVVSAHEGALANLYETALVWQTAESRASTARGRLHFLRRHSPRALGLAPCVRRSPEHVPNCEWTPDLLARPSEPPRALDADWWRAARAEPWARVQRYALALVFGVEMWRPCACKPFTWGYAGDLDGALRRGLVPCGCAFVDQDGFALASKTLPASVASGGAL